MRNEYTIDESIKFIQDCIDAKDISFKEERDRYNKMNINTTNDKLKILCYDIIKGEIAAKSDFINGDKDINNKELGNFVRGVVALQRGICLDQERKDREEERKRKEEERILEDCRRQAEEKKEEN